MIQIRMSSPNPARTTPRPLMSESSNCTSGRANALTALVRAGTKPSHRRSEKSMLRSVVGMTQRLRQIRRSHRQQRPLLQLPQESSDPDASKRERNRKIQPMQPEPVAISLRHDEPEQIDESHENKDPDNAT